MDTFIGQIALFPYSYVPKGWAICNGQILLIAQNQALYSLIGNNFGGQPGVSFALPNYLGLAPAGSSYFIALQGYYPSPP